jgi:hypothetical protein
MVTWRNFCGSARVLRANDNFYGLILDWQAFQKLEIICIKFEGSSRQQPGGKHWEFQKSLERILATTVTHSRNHAPARIGVPYVINCSSWRKHKTRKESSFHVAGFGKHQTIAGSIVSKPQVSEIFGDQPIHVGPRFYLLPLKDCSL